MRKTPASSLVKDDNGLTAVIEFLSAFALFLMILTAFLSLAQLEMGSNDPSVDRLDRAASQGIDRLTSDGGWFVPMTTEGEMDYPNSTSNWHQISIDELNSGVVQAGLVSQNTIDFDRVEALGNITEDNLLKGLGMSPSFSLNIEIKIIESDIQSREGEVLFEGGTDRSTSKASSSSSVVLQKNNEKVQIILEIHDGGRKSNALYITEISPRSVSGSAEWIEIYNPNDFAIDLNGWSFQHTSPSVDSNILLRQGVLSGLSTAIFTGDLNIQETGQAQHVFDLGVEGFLGVGGLDLLDDSGGLLLLSYTQLDEFQPFEVTRVQWGSGTDYFLTPSQSLEWNGNFPQTVADWTVNASPSPGII